MLDDPISSMVILEGAMRRLGAEPRQVPGSIEELLGPSSGQVLAVLDGSSSALTSSAEVERFRGFIDGFGVRDGIPPFGWVKVDDVVVRLFDLIGEELELPFWPDGISGRMGTGATDASVLSSAFVMTEALLLVLCGVGRTRATSIASSAANMSLLLGSGEVGTKLFWGTADPISYLQFRSDWAAGWVIALDAAIERRSPQWIRRVLKTAMPPVAAEAVIQVDLLASGSIGIISEIAAVIGQLVQWSHGHAETIWAGEFSSNLT